MMRRISLLVATLMLASPAAADATSFPFSGRTSQGGAVKFRVSSKFVSVTNFTIGWKADCTSGANVVDVTAVSRLPIHPFPRFTAAGGYAAPDAMYSAANGQTLSYAVSVHLRGILPRNAHAHGTWTAHVQIRDTNQNVIDTCTTGVVSWHARLP
jgi:hypothetical protein